MLSLSLIFSLDKNVKIHLSLQFCDLYPTLNKAQSNGNSVVSIYEKETNKYINKRINRYIEII